jgi:hypothetical protein
MVPVLSRSCMLVPHFAQVHRTPLERLKLFALFHCAFVPPHGRDFQRRELYSLRRFAFPLCSLRFPAPLRETHPRRSLCIRAAARNPPTRKRPYISQFPLGICNKLNIFAPLRRVCRLRYALNRKPEIINSTSWVVYSKFVSPRCLPATIVWQNSLPVSVKKL